MTLVHQRYQLREEASRGGSVTVLYKQLTALVHGVDFNQHEFGCKNNIVTATNLKHRYKEAKKVIMQKLPTSAVSTTPTRVHSSRPPRKRLQQSPGSRSGITPQSKRERDGSKCSSSLVERADDANVNSHTLRTRRSLFPASSHAAVHEDVNSKLPQPEALLPTRIPQAKVCISQSFLHGYN